MINQNSKKSVLIVDKQNFWRKLSFNALTSAGYRVSVFKSYIALKKKHRKLKDKPDLIIIGCAKTCVEEFELIDSIKRSNIKQLVLCTFLTSDEMRILFQKGANDVAKKPFSSSNLVEVVEESFHGLSTREQYELKHISENL